jgi:tetratricopeptide (TPR) repeat protein
MRPECRRLPFILLILLVAACRTAVPPPAGEIPSAPSPGAVDAPSTAVPDADAPRKRQQEQAAAALTERGRGLLDAGRIDPAMRLFEQALSLSPHYGPGYYFMAEAWLAKDNWSQAREFHRQASLYLNADGGWQARVARQRARIERAAAAGVP